MLHSLDWEWKWNFEGVLESSSKYTQMVKCPMVRNGNSIIGICQLMRHHYDEKVKLIIAAFSKGTFIVMK